MTAGLSFEKALRESVLVQNKCKMKCSLNIKDLKQNLLNCPRIKPILCNLHFDWTIIEKAEREGHTVAPILLLRNPVERLVSHFCYAKTRQWSGDNKFQNQTLIEFLSDL